MNVITIHTSFGGMIYLRNLSQIGWEVEIYSPKGEASGERRLIINSNYFKSKSGAMNFIKRTIHKYASIMGEIVD